MMGHQYIIALGAAPGQLRGVSNGEECGLLLIGVIFSGNLCVEVFLWNLKFVSCNRLQAAGLQNLRRLLTFKALTGH